MIEFSNVSFSYAKGMDSHGSKNIFDSVNLKINRGEFLFVVGESGIGKTTLLKLIYMELFPKDGIVKVGDYRSDKIDVNEIPFLRRKIGIVFQDFKLMDDRNIFENIAIPLYIEGEKKQEIRKKVFDISTKTGLFDKLKDFPSTLSGGEQQRVAIARALVKEPLVLIADEPTGNLDPFIAIEIVKLLNEINVTGTSVIVATHNFDIVRKMKDKKIIQIRDSKLCEVNITI
jgi:cell division transport system ATP-binding protein